MTPPKAVVAWSSGKDCAFALLEAERSGLVTIVGLLTTVSEVFGRVAMHGVRESVLDRQAEALGLPVHKVNIPYPCPNEIYETHMAEACAHLKEQGVSVIIFGDIFLEDVRAYREHQLRATGLQGLFPLWGRETGALASEMLSCGVMARVACLDPARLDRRYTGCHFDHSFLGDLPATVDVCGENGEFHTLLTHHPMFSRPVCVCQGQIVERDGFVYADFELE